jgi:hypothetical protein
MISEQCGPGAAATARGAGDGIADGRRATHTATAVAAQVHVASASERDAIDGTLAELLGTTLAHRVAPVIAAKLRQIAARWWGSGYLADGDAAVLAFALRCADLAEGAEGETGP